MATPFSSLDSHRFGRKEAGVFGAANELFQHDFSHQRAGLNDLRIRDPVKDVQALSAWDDNPFLPEDRQVLRYVCLARTHLLGQIVDVAFLLAEQHNDLQSF